MNGDAPEPLAPEDVAAPVGRHEIEGPVVPDAPVAPVAPAGKPPSAFSRGLDSVYESLVDPRTLRIMLPAALGFVLLPWIVVQLRRELQSPLYRDAAMIQYTGWCIRHGERLYKDVGTPDGPFIHFLHAGIQLFAGISDHGARVVDGFIHLIGSGLMGWVLAPRLTSSRTARVLGEASWVLLGALAWFAWYLGCGWEDTVQRDPYYALCGYLGLTMLYAAPRFAGRQSRIYAAMGGACVTIEIFTRHSGTIYGAMALALLALEEGDVALRRMRFRFALYGMGASLAAMFFLLLFCGSFKGFGYWYFHFPFEGYRFIGKHAFWNLFTQKYADQTRFCAMFAAGVFSLVAMKLVPRRIIPFVVAPFLFLIAACVVGKGWRDHVYQVDGAENVILLVVLSELFRRRSDHRVWGSMNGLVAAIALCVLADHCVYRLENSDFNKSEIHVSGDEQAAIVVATALASYTRPDDRIFYYAHEMHGLLFAERKSALPNFGDIILNLAAWMRADPSDAGLVSDADHARFDRFQAEVSQGACDRLRERHPAAIVIKPHDMGMWSLGDPIKELQGICPEIPHMLEHDYHLKPAGDFQVYYRNDRAL